MNDLKPSNVQILENGKPQTVKECEFVAPATAPDEQRQFSLPVDSGSSDSLSMSKEFAASGMAQDAPGIEISVSKHPVRCCFR